MYSNRRPPTRGSLAFGLAVCVLMATVGMVAFLFGVIPKVQSSQRLLSEGQPVSAQITGVYDDKNRDRYAKYAYQVNGQTYSGKDHYSGGYGDRGPIRVFYLPSQPDFSAIDREGLSNNSKLMIPFMLLWEGIIVAAFFGIRSQWKRAV